MNSSAKASKCQDAPYDGIDYLDECFERSEKEREQREYPGDTSNDERPEMRLVIGGEETQWYEDQHNGFLVYMPPKHVRSVAAQCQSANKGFVGRSLPKLGQKHNLERNGD